MPFDLFRCQDGQFNRNLSKHHPHAFFSQRVMTECIHPMSIRGRRKRRLVDVAYERDHQRDKPHSLPVPDTAGTPERMTPG